MGSLKSQRDHRSGSSPGSQPYSEELIMPEAPLTPSVILSAPSVILSAAKDQALELISSFTLSLPKTRRRADTEGQPLRSFRLTNYSAIRCQKLL